jgi:hypothetical protein
MDVEAACSRVHVAGVVANVNDLLVLLVHGNTGTGPPRARKVPVVPVVLPLFGFLTPLSPTGDCIGLVVPINAVAVEALHSHDNTLKDATVTAHTRVVRIRRCRVGLLELEPEHVIAVFGTL